MVIQKAPADISWYQSNNSFFVTKISQDLIILIKIILNEIGSTIFGTTPPIWYRIPIMCLI